MFNISREKLISREMIISTYKRNIPGPVYSPRPAETPR